MSKKAIKQSPQKTNKQINKQVPHVRASEQKMFKMWKNVKVKIWKSFIYNFSLQFFFCISIITLFTFKLTG